MSITSYDTLKAAIASWLARDDLAATIPDAIALFEAAANRRLRVRKRETTATLTPVAGSAALPADYLAWRSLRNESGPLDYAHPTWLDALYSAGAAAPARHFTIIGDTLVVRPADDSPLTFRYFRKVPALSDSAPVNWLLADNPDLYLFGALCEASAATLDLETAAFWKARRDEAFAELTGVQWHEPGALAIRVVGATP